MKYFIQIIFLVGFFFSLAVVYVHSLVKCPVTLIPVNTPAWQQHCPNTKGNYFPFVDSKAAQFIPSIVGAGPPNLRSVSLDEYQQLGYPLSMNVNAPHVQLTVSNQIFPFICEFIDSVKWIHPSKFTGTRTDVNFLSRVTVADNKTNELSSHCVNNQFFNRILFSTLPSISRILLIRWMLI